MYKPTKIQTMLDQTLTKIPRNFQARKQYALINLDHDRYDKEQLGTISGFFAAGVLPLSGNLRVAVVLLMSKSAQV